MINSGDTAFMLVATALVMFMMPGSPYKAMQVIKKCL